MHKEVSITTIADLPIALPILDFGITGMTPDLQISRDSMPPGRPSLPPLFLRSGILACDQKL